ncbi:Uncharacterised protein [Sphingomonas paucimobilis]|nr:Uncharacterised protein [Sphingomonas paucimobilis]
MGRRNVGQLPKPPRRFRPNLKVGAGFETKAAARAEDNQRIRKLKSYCASLVEKGKRDEVDKAITGIKSASCCASSCYMRKRRIRLGGHVWLQHDLDGRTGATFTLIPKWGKVDCDSLALVDPVKMLERLRAAFNRAGAGQVGGWLIVGIHGEHDPTKGVYVIHFHGYCTGGMIGVIDRLRGQPSFKSKHQRKDGSDVQRVHRSRAPLDNLPRPLTYPFQGFWPAKASFVAQNERSKRQRRKHRIKEPMHSEVLLWLARWRIQDLVLLLGIRVTKSGMEPCAKRTAICG